MKYFKNSELVRLYNISDKSVRNWIEAARHRKLALELYELKGKVYVADTVGNERIIAALVQRGRKYQNHRSHRNLKPKPELYRLFSLEQIVDIANRIDIDKEIPMQYSYFSSGADYWNSYLNRLYAAGPGNILTNTVELLDSNLAYILKLTNRFRDINIINTCIGNSSTLKGVIGTLEAMGSLKKLALVDISPDMLQYSEQKVSEWVEPNKIEKFIRDVGSQKIGDILSTQNAYANRAVNLVFMVAGPIVNFKDPDQVLRNIRESMGKDDLFIMSLKLDTEQTRKFFDFGVEPNESPFDFQQQLLLDLLNINRDLYDPEFGFDGGSKLRSIRVRFKVNASIEFRMPGFKRVVELHRGDSLITMRSHHHNELDIIQRLKRAGFDPLQISKSQDKELILLVSGIQTA